MFFTQEAPPALSFWERLGGLFRKARKRHAALQQLWKPVGIILSIISSLAAAYKFVEAYGRLTLPVAGLLLLGICLLMTVPVQGIKLCALRAVAFLVDTLFLGALTFVGLLVYRPQGVYPGAPILMLVVWLWFFYFVIFDWRSATTPGKQLFGLQVISVRNSRLSFCALFVRGIIVLIPTLLGDGLFGNAYVMTGSFLGMAFGITLMSLIPMSVVMLGGNQGIVDATVGIAIKSGGKRVEPWPLRKALRRLPTIFLSSLALGIFLTFFIALAHRELPFGRPAGKPALSGLEGVAQNRVVVDPSAVGALWMSLPQGIKSPTSVIRYIQILEATPNSFSFDPAKSRIYNSLSSKIDFEKYGNIRIIQISLSVTASSLIKLQIMHNLATYLGPSIPLSERPKYVILEFLTEYDFGFFRFNSAEDILFSMMISEGRPEDSYAELSGGGTFFQLGESLHDVRWLLLGGLRWVDSERPYPQF